MLASTLRTRPDLFPPRDRGRRRRELWLRGAVAILVAVLLLAGAGVLAVHWVLRGSLPRLDGTQPLPGLTAPVHVERDALGIPTLHARTRIDVARALGFLHAQERFFQMDLLRRAAAGELAALVGDAALPLDRAARVHRFRVRARRLAHAEPRRDLLRAYTEGVNAGLAALRTRPFEYFLLRTRPEPWRQEDVFLCVFAMYLDLEASASARESALALIHDTLPGPLARFLTAPGNAWDAPVSGAPLTVPPIPGPEVYDLSRSQQAHRVPGSGDARAEDHFARDGEPTSAASNSWALAGSLTTTGAPLVAGDMHLDLAVPNTWYRASWVLPDSVEGKRRFTGVTLPGTPALVAGSNGDVAWALTNANIDVADLVVVELDSLEESHYRTPDGLRALERHAEVIRVRGADAETLWVRETHWGPIVDRDVHGRPRALHWVAHQPYAADLGLLDLETARSVRQAFDAAHRCSVPPLNLVAADRDGHLGWTILGPVPQRFGFDGRLPASWADGTRGWRGRLPASQVPEILDPPGGRLWTANARVVSGRALALLGDSGYVLGARARQIRDDLRALHQATPRDLLRVQLDDRAVFLERWQRLLLDVLTPEAVAADTNRARMRTLVERWGAQASVGSVGYRLVRAFRLEVIDALLEPLLAPCRARDDRLRNWHLRQREGPVWKLLEQRPRHLLAPRWASWDAFLLAQADSVLAIMRRIGPVLAERTWGERNTVRVRHPLSRAVPLLSRWLDMPRRRLPGDGNMPRVQGPQYGASQRMVVAPGQEDAGIFHMPCGQSGHPKSPFYRNGHAAWEEGQPTAFLPGPTLYRLTLQ